MTTNKKASEQGTADGLEVAAWTAFMTVKDAPSARQMIAELDADKWSWDGDLHTPLPTFGSDEADEAYYSAAQDAWETELRRHAVAIVLEDLRAAINAESISYGEIAELQGLAPYIPEGDAQLREWAAIAEEIDGPDAVNAEVSDYLAGYVTRDQVSAEAAAIIDQVDG